MRNDRKNKNPAETAETAETARNGTGLKKWTGFSEAKGNAHIGGNLIFLGLETRVIWGNAWVETWERGETAVTGRAEEEMRDIAVYGDQIAERSKANIRV